jgi:hypothetical protein
MGIRGPGKDFAIHRKVLKDMAKYYLGCSVENWAEVWKQVDQVTGY